MTDQEKIDELKLIALELLSKYSSSENGLIEEFEGAPQCYEAEKALKKECSDYRDRINSF